MKSTKIALTGALFVLASVCGAQAADIDVTGTAYSTNSVVIPNIYRLAGNTTWTSNNTYRMMGIIMVPSGVTLTIEPGTVVRGANERSVALATNPNDAKYRPGMLIVEKGGKLFARGTAKNPICFTDEWDNNFAWKGQTGTSVSRTYQYRKGSDNSDITITTNYNYGAVGNLHGVWGGIVLCGKALVNNDTTAVPPVLGTLTWTVEGTGSTWGITGGGNDDEDSSGELTYVQIRYGGSLVGDGKEINGLTMYGVGRGTVLHHIEVFNNQDDCIEWFGGTVEAKYLIGWGAGDDIFDSDAGFRGKNQFCFGVQRDMGGYKLESGASDKGMEMDGFEKEDGQILYSASQWNNVTLIGNQYTKNSSTRYRNIALTLKDNPSPRIYNSVFMDFGGPATLIEDYDIIADPASGVSGTIMNAAQRFTWSYSQFPTYTANNSRLGTVIGRDGIYQTAANDDKQACIRGAIFWNCGKAAAGDGVYGTGGSGLALITKGAQATAGDYAKNVMAIGVSTTAGSGPWSTKDTYFTNWIADVGNVTDLWDFNDADGYMPIQSRTRTFIDPAVPANNTAYPITGGASSSGSYHLTQVDPRPANDATNGAVAVSDGWLTPTTFRGAFAPEANWAKGCTTLDSMGVFGNDSSVPGGDVGQTVMTTVVTTGVNGIVYQPDGSLTPDTGMNSVAAAGLQTSPVLTYTITAAGTYQLQSTPSMTAPITWSVEKTFSVGAGDVPVTVNLTDILAEPAASSMFYKLLKQ